MEFAGAAAGSSLLATRFSPAGRQTRGTHNNCGNGYTPWGTYLTTEENFIGYFQRSGSDEYARTDAEKIALKRYGLGVKKMNLICMRKMKKVHLKKIKMARSFT